MSLIKLEPYQQPPPPSDRLYHAEWTVYLQPTPDEWLASLRAEFGAMASKMVEERIREFDERWGAKFAEMHKEVTAKPQQRLDEQYKGRNAAFHFFQHPIRAKL